MGSVPTVSQDELKKQAGFAAAEQFVKNGMVVGLGTGSTAAHAIKKIGEQVKGGWDIVGIPTSIESECLATECGIRLSTLADHPAVDVTIDGADEVDPSFNLIKGMGGALLREKLVAEHTEKEIIIVDESKLVKTLGTKSPLPVEVVPFSLAVCERRLRALGCEPVLRRKDGKVYVTDNGNNVLDCRFKAIPDPAALDAKLCGITGVVENGLFIGLTHAVVVASAKGVRVLSKA